MTEMRAVYRRTFLTLGAAQADRDRLTSYAGGYTASDVDLTEEPGGWAVTVREPVVCYCGKDHHVARDGRVITRSR